MEKQRCWKTWKKGDSKQEYQKAKRIDKHAVYLTKSQAKKEKPKDLSPSNNDLFRLANQMRRKDLYVQGEKSLPNDAGKLCLDDKAKPAAWKEHYGHLSNVDLDWDPDSLKEVYPVEGPAPHIPLGLAIKAIKLMKCGKVAGISLIVLKCWKPLELEGLSRFVI